MTNRRQDSVCNAFSSIAGLTSAEAKKRRRSAGPNTLKRQSKYRGLYLFLAQFKSPLILLLAAAAILSGFLGARTDSMIILTIVLVSGCIGFFQERGAIKSLDKLLGQVAVRVKALRDGQLMWVRQEELVCGDVVELSAGDRVPADCRVIAAKNLFVNEAIITGESMPVEKSDVLFMGSSISSGYVQAIVIATGKQTKFGALVERARLYRGETAFEMGVKHFGFFLMEVTMILVFIIFSLNIFLHRPYFESLLFAVALAVGLTPQLLPAIISVNLAHGAKKMALHKVIVKRLASIENFGQIDVLLCDKTGTLTEGDVKLVDVIDAWGAPSLEARRLIALNAHFQEGYTNPLDRAILEAAGAERGWRKLDEKPYDFLRKRLVVLIQRDQETIAITKGAVLPTLSICTRVQKVDGSIVSIDEEKKEILDTYERESKLGTRLLAVAYTRSQTLIEEGFIFVGFARFIDPIRRDVHATVSKLKNLGIGLKMITGDNRHVAMYVAAHIGMTDRELVTGDRLHEMSDEALLALAREKNVFAEVEPNQKEKIILALRASGHVTGFLGDGMNDVSALHAADVGIAVEGGADAAKEAADIVLLKKDLSVLHAGVSEGRRTFANTLKYVYMATSANFGNMFSMAIASLFLPFLPLLPKQILLTNFFTDIPEMAISSDAVDEMSVSKPRRWDFRAIRRFMLVFGCASSIFDLITFGVLLYFFHASEQAFQSGWFLESVASSALVIFSLRTHKPMFTSMPSIMLGVSIFSVVILVTFLPMLPVAQNLFSFVPLPASFYAIVLGIVISYLVSVEWLKRIFFKTSQYRGR